MACENTYLKAARFQTLMVWNLLVSIKGVKGFLLSPSAFQVTSSVVEIPSS